MSDLRDLRLAIQAKLEHRRELMATNAQLSARNGQLSREKQFLLDAMRSPLFSLMMERMADEIAQAVVDEAIKCSEAVARETEGQGFFKVGITIPALHIRLDIYRPDLEVMRHDRSAGIQETFKRVSYVAKPYGQ